MCRHIAYLGPPVRLGEILVDPAHSLVRQSWEPRRQRSGTVNADGFGVGWYADGDPVPGRYRRSGPVWGDETFADLARVVRGTAFVGAVRDATWAGADGEAAAAPFASGPLLFSHNGAVRGWPGSLAPLAAPCLRSGCSTWRRAVTRRWSGPSCSAGSRRATSSPRHSRTR